MDKETEFSAAMARLRSTATLIASDASTADARAASLDTAAEMVAAPPAAAATPRDASAAMARDASRHRFEATS